MDEEEEKEKENCRSIASLSRRSSLSLSFSFFTASFAHFLFFFPFQQTKPIAFYPAKDGTKHVGLKLDRIRHWLSQGAQPSKSVASLLHRAGVAPAPPRSAPKMEGVRNPDKRPAKTARAAAAAGLVDPAAGAVSA